MTTPPSVEADLGWALGMVTRAHLRTAQEVVAGLPGGPRGYHVLTVANEGPPPTQLALARKVGLDRTVLTYLLDELVEAGLVERRPDPADRRARQILLTDTGRTRLCDLERRLREAEERLLGPLVPAERVQLRSMLSRLAVEAAEPAHPCVVAEELGQSC